MHPFQMSLENGIITDISLDDVELNNKEKQFLALPPLVNAHTHIGDAFITGELNGGIMELVSPPNGLKHRRLREADEREIKDGMEGALEEMYMSGVRSFIDFREQGVHGIRMLKDALDSFNSIHAHSDRKPISATILGRPDSGDDIDELLTLSDGLGISSISDHDIDYLRELRGEVERHRKKFALHVSERIREDIDTVIELRPDFIVHMNEATDEDMQRVAEAGIPVVVCPSSNMFFGKIPPIRRMLEAKIKVALGTDNLMLNSPSILREMSILNIAMRFAGTPLDYREIIEIGVDNPRDIAGMRPWKPDVGQMWEGILLRDYGRGTGQLLRG